MARLRVTLIRSTIGRNDDQIRTARNLGLNKVNSSVEKEDTPIVRGMINKIKHLVKVEEI